jgi:hypothetical protein
VVTAEGSGGEEEGHDVCGDGVTAVKSQSQCVRRGGDGRCDRDGLVASDVDSFEIGKDEGGCRVYGNAMRCDNVMGG